MLLFSLQLIQERLGQVCLCTLQSHVKSTDYLLTTGFQI